MSEFTAPEATPTTSERTEPMTEHMTDPIETTDTIETTAPDLRQVAFGKLMKIQRLSLALHHHEVAKGSPHADPTRGQGRVLALLQVKDGLATRDMAMILGIRPASLNETLARLERDGLVERRPNEEDRRQQLVYLTEEGKARDTRPPRLHDQAFDGFTDDELTQLIALLDRAATNMEAELGPEAQAEMEQMRAHRREFFGPKGPRGPHGTEGPEGPERPCPRGKGPRGKRGPWGDDRPESRGGRPPFDGHDLRAERYPLPDEPPMRHGSHGRGKGHESGKPCPMGSSCQGWQGCPYDHACEHGHDDDMRSA